MQRSAAELIRVREVYQPPQTPSSLQGEVDEKLIKQSIFAIQMDDLLADAEKNFIAGDHNKLRETDSQTADLLKEMKKFSGKIFPVTSQKILLIELIDRGLVNALDTLINEVGISLDLENINGNSFLDHIVSKKEDYAHKGQGMASIHSKMEKFIRSKIEELNKPIDSMVHTMQTKASDALEAGNKSELQKIDLEIESQIQQYLKGIPAFSAITRMKKLLLPALDKGLLNTAKTLFNDCGVSIGRTESDNGILSKITARKNKFAENVEIASIFTEMEMFVTRRRNALITMDQHIISMYDKCNAGRFPTEEDDNNLKQHLFNLLNTGFGINSSLVAESSPTLLQLVTVSNQKYTLLQKQYHEKLAGKIQEYKKLKQEEFGSEYVSDDESENEFVDKEPVLHNSLKFLLKRGADPHQKKSDEYTAITIAKKNSTDSSFQPEKQDFLLNLLENYPNSLKSVLNIKGYKDNINFFNTRLIQQSNSYIPEDKNFIARLKKLIIPIDDFEELLVESHLPGFKFDEPIWVKLGQAGYTESLKILLDTGLIDLDKKVIPLELAEGKREWFTLGEWIKNIAAKDNKITQDHKTALEQTLKVIENKSASLKITSLLAEEIEFCEERYTKGENVESKDTLPLVKEYMNLCRDQGIPLSGHFLHEFISLGAFNTVAFMLKNGYLLSHKDNSGQTVFLTLKEAKQEINNFDGDYRAEFQKNLEKIGDLFTSDPNISKVKNESITTLINFLNHRQSFKDSWKFENEKSKRREALLLTLENYFALGGEPNRTVGNSPVTILEAALSYPDFGGVELLVEAGGMTKLNAEACLEKVSKIMSEVTNEKKSLPKNKKLNNEQEILKFKLEEQLKYLNKVKKLLNEKAESLDEDEVKSPSNNASLKPKKNKNAGRARLVQKEQKKKELEAERQSNLKKIRAAELAEEAKEEEAQRIEAARQKALYDNQQRKKAEEAETQRIAELKEKARIRKKRFPNQNNRIPQTTSTNPSAFSHIQVRAAQPSAPSQARVNSPPSNAVPQAQVKPTPPNAASQAQVKPIKPNVPLIPQGRPPQPNVAPPARVNPIIPAVPLRSLKHPNTEVPIKPVTTLPSPKPPVDSSKTNPALGSESKAPIIKNLDDPSADSTGAIHAFTPPKQSINSGQPKEFFARVPPQLPPPNAPIEPKGNRVMRGRETRQTTVPTHLPQRQINQNQNQPQYPQQQLVWYPQSMLNHPLGTFQVQSQPFVQPSSPSYSGGPLEGSYAYNPNSQNPMPAASPPYQGTFMSNQSMPLPAQPPPGTVAHPNHPGLFFRYSHSAGPVDIYHEAISGHQYNLYVNGTLNGDLRPA